MPTSSYGFFDIEAPKWRSVASGTMLCNSNVSNDARSAPTATKGIRRIATGGGIGRVGRNGERNRLDVTGAVGFEHLM